MLTRIHLRLTISFRPWDRHLVLYCHGTDSLINQCRPWDRYSTTETVYGFTLLCVCVSACACMGPCVCVSVCVCVVCVSVCVTNVKYNLPDNLQLLKVNSILHLLEGAKVSVLFYH